VGWGWEKRPQTEREKSHGRGSAAASAAAAAGAIDGDNKGGARARPWRSCGGGRLLGGVVNFLWRRAAGLRRGAACAAERRGIAQGATEKWGHGRWAGAGRIVAKKMFVSVSLEVWNR
jgi:hypothetical protein